MERIYKETNSTNQSTIPIDEKVVVDLHLQQTTTTEQDNSVISTAYTELGFLTTLTFINLYF